MKLTVLFFGNIQKELTSLKIERSMKLFEYLTCFAGLMFIILSVVVHEKRGENIKIKHE